MIFSESKTHCVLLCKGCIKSLSRWFWKKCISGTNRKSYFVRCIGWYTHRCDLSYHNIWVCNCVSTISLSCLGITSLFSSSLGSFASLTASIIASSTSTMSPICNMRVLDTSTTESNAHANRSKRLWVDTIKTLCEKKKQREISELIIKEKEIMLKAR